MGDHSRRKRRDPQSRDFLCLCGKSYLSYAAAYTHVKNKHQSDQKYYYGITKPSRQNLTRGRPKEKKFQQPTNHQTKSLSIIQDAILKIYQQISHHQPTHSNIILQGNQFIQQLHLKAQYDKINQNSIQTNIFQFKNQFKQYQNQQLVDQLITFQSAINKHFQAQIVAKIRYYLNYLYQNSKNAQTNWKQQNDFEDKPKFFDNNQIYTIIQNTFQKWVKINNELT